MKLSEQIAQEIQRKHREENVPLYQCILESLDDVNFDERMRDQFNAVEQYKKQTSLLFSDDVTGIMKVFPNGLYTKTDEGDLVGATVITKSLIKRALQNRQNLSIENNDFEFDLDDVIEIESSVWDDILLLLMAILIIVVVFASYVILTK